MSYEAALIKKRLVELHKLKQKAVEICEETPAPLFDAIRRFNESRNSSEKIRIAEEIKRLGDRASTWVERSKKAWEQRMKIDEEAHELRNRLWYLER
jgi:vacuolar-type H+-ATPase subunit I/STV1